MKYRFHGPDGYKNWESFRIANKDREPWSNPYGEDTLAHASYKVHRGMACVINTHDGGVVELYPDGTWSYDCEPDWNGAS